MDCIGRIEKKLKQCSEEEEVGCKHCPIREECAQWFANVPAYVADKECSAYILKAFALRGKKRRVKREHKQQDGTGDEEVRGDDAG